MEKVIGKQCVILAGSAIDIKTVCVPKNAIVLCADKGYLAARKLGIEPTLCIGDFDSLGFVPYSYTDKTKIFPRAKDDTDTLLAVKEALKMGMSEIFIYGALGGRLDHTIANIQTLMFIEENGSNGMLIGENECVSLMIHNTSRFFKRREGFYFSVFSYSEKCTGVNLRGTEYTLTDGILKNDFPLGISNHIVEDYAEVSLRDGCLLIIESKEV